jgi:hypothetical protein
MVPNWSTVLLPVFFHILLVSSSSSILFILKNGILYIGFKYVILVLYSGHLFSRYRVIVSLRHFDVALSALLK